MYRLWDTVRSAQPACISWQQSWQWVPYLHLTETTPKLDPASKWQGQDLIAGSAWCWSTRSQLHPQKADFSRRLSRVTVLLRQQPSLVLYHTPENQAYKLGSYSLNVALWTNMATWGLLSVKTAYVRVVCAFLLLDLPCLSIFDLQVNVKLLCRLKEH